MYYILDIHIKVYSFNAISFFRFSMITIYKMFKRLHTCYCFVCSHAQFYIVLNDCSATYVNGVLYGCLFFCESRKMQFQFNNIYLWMWVCVFTDDIRCAVVVVSSSLYILFVSRHCPAFVAIVHYCIMCNELFIMAITAFIAIAISNSEYKKNNRKNP